MNTAMPTMDRRLKERLIGATILVAVIVLVVPELLSGRKHPALPPLAAGLPTSSTRSVSVDLATNRATAEPETSAASQAPPSGAPNPAPDAAASGAAAASAAGNATSAAAPAADAGETAPASAPGVATLRAQNGAQPLLETPVSSPKSAATTARSVGPAESASAPHHTWAVQLGSFASKANAERLAHRLQTAGGSFYVAPGGSGAALRYRVRMGPLADRGAAERALAKLKAQGHAATIVTPAS
jgi:DedD protein